MNEKIKILLIEDNPADADLTKENLEHSKILHELFIAKDGVEAMDFLRREAGFADRPRPDLIFLDLNLPRKDGRAVLKEIKADETLKCIPVVVLTSSKAEEDIVRAYNLYASAYITKPVDLDGFGKIVRGIEGFWFSVVRFPPEIQ